VGDEDGSMTPEIQYARNADVAIAFTVVGQGPVDVAYLSSFSNLEAIWENQDYARFLRSLASFARLIVVDKRGTGISDRVSPSDLPPLEDLVDDLTAVLDAVGSERVVPFGVSDSGALSAMYASTRPDRTAGLILHGATARGRQDADYPWQWSEEEWQEYLATILTRWGTPEYALESLAQYNPSLADDERACVWWGRFQRLSASPGAIYAMDNLMREMDIRQLLPAISVPTLILHREDDRIEDVGSGRYLAEQIAGSRYVELPGGDHFPWAGDQDAVIDQIRPFLGEVQEEHEESFDRVLATIMFTDMVDSTAQAATLGDRRWRELQERHDGLVRAQLARYRGREMDTAGDGFFALFDGPARAVRCASAICTSMRSLGVEVRAGLHTGEIQSSENGASGIAVAIGARVGALAGAGEVLVSSTVKDLVVGSGLEFEERGLHTLKGVPDEWRLFAVASPG
jgi:pimeloyl-ACP methyl ester carboxylesterase/class 3 adenylate cyclase